MIVNYASDAAGAERVVAEIGRGDGRAIAVQADVSSAADVQRLFSAAEREFGAPDIVANNAGVFRFELTQEAVKHLGAGGGSVINVSS